VQLILAKQFQNHNFLTLTHIPNPPPAAAHLIVTEYKYHKYVFCPALNEGLKYGKAENVTLERLKNDLLQNKQSREKFRSFAHALADLCEAAPNHHQ
jgi:hypothetical protein